MYSTLRKRTMLVATGRRLSRCWIDPRRALCCCAPALRASELAPPFSSFCRAALGRRLAPPSPWHAQRSGGGAQGGPEEGDRGPQGGPDDPGELAGLRRPRSRAPCVARTLGCEFASSSCRQKAGSCLARASRLDGIRGTTKRPYLPPITDPAPSIESLLTATSQV